MPLEFHIGEMWANKSETTVYKIFGIEELEFFKGWGIGEHKVVHVGVIPIKVHGNSCSVNGGKESWVLKNFAKWVHHRIEE